MYVTIRKYADGGGSIGILATPLREGFLPLLRRVPGFVGYWAFASQDGHAVSVDLYDDRDSAAHADGRVRGWVAANLRDLLPNPPEVTSGTVMVCEQETRPERRSADGEASWWSSTTTASRARRIGQHSGFALTSSRA